MILITWVILFTIIIAYFLQTALPLFDGVDSMVGFQSVDPGFASCFHLQMNLFCCCCCFFFGGGWQTLVQLLNHVCKQQTDLPPAFYDLLW